MSFKRKQRGFTLMEALITVAIIAVIAAVALPTFTAARKQSVENTCYANRAAMQTRVEATLLRSRGKTEDEMLEMLNDELKGYQCPAGGTYTVKNSNGNWVICCSVHGSDLETTPFDYIKLLMSAGSFTVITPTKKTTYTGLYDYFNKMYGSSTTHRSLDSEAPRNKDVAGAAQQVENTLGTYYFQSNSWRIVYYVSKGTIHIDYLWCDYDIKNAKIGQALTVTKCATTVKKDGQLLTKAYYTSSTVTVGGRSTGTTTFNTIDEGKSSDWTPVSVNS